jgi:ParB family chromosome partitioning protein
MNRRALGRGLEALIPAPAPAAEAPARDDGPRRVSVSAIRRNPLQPRTSFDETSLGELAASIRDQGLIQPLVVRAVPGGYELIAGERRFLAAQRAGLTEVPVVVREATRRDMLEVALTENVQREDLNPIEEAEAFQRLADEFGLNQEDIAARVGKSRTAVTNALRLLALEEDLRALVVSGRLSAGHARALLALGDPQARRRLAAEIVEKGLSVREAEARTQAKRARAQKPARRRLHPALESTENAFRDRFATQVRIVGGVGRGRVEIHYFSEEDLERILELSGVQVR